MKPKKIKGDFSRSRAINWPLLNYSAPYKKDVRHNGIDCNKIDGLPLKWPTGEENNSATDFNFKEMF